VAGGARDAVEQRQLAALRRALWRAASFRPPPVDLRWTDAARGRFCVASTLARRTSIRLVVAFGLGCSAGVIFSPAVLRLMMSRDWRQGSRHQHGERGYLVVEGAPNAKNPRLGMPGRDVSGLGRVGKRKRGEPGLARISSLAAGRRPCRKAVSSPSLLV
jgi:hypothetical protein